MKMRPNILLIVSDQHRYDCVGSSKIYPVKTPHLDRLAAEGMRFSQAYTPIPLCCPARQSFLSGRRPESFGAICNYDFLPVKGLEPDHYAWPKDLKEAGYHNAYAGKWHVHPQYDPTSYGYDEYFGDQDYKRIRQEKYPNVNLFANGFEGTTDPADLEDTQTYVTARKVSEWMDRYTEEGVPWHIRLDFNEPHLPCCPAEPFASSVKAEDIPVWGSFDEDFRNKPYIQQQQLINWNVENYTWEDWAPVVARYYAVIAQMDDSIGRVLAHLDKLGIAEDTLVIYTSDHGDMCGGHRMMDKHYIMYDDVVKVPLLVRWPGTIRPGSECNRFVHHFLDLPPTLLEATGQLIPEFFHGRSLMPLWKEQNVDDWREEAVSTYNGQQFGLFTQRMIRTYRWKYVWNPTDVDELYDLEQDPHELRNAVGKEQHAETIKQLRYRLYVELEKTDDPIIVGNGWMQAQLTGQPLQQQLNDMIQWFKAGKPKSPQ